MLFFFNNANLKWRGDPDKESIEKKVNEWKSNLEERGLKMNVSKTVDLYILRTKKIREAMRRMMLMILLKK